MFWTVVLLIFIAIGLVVVWLHISIDRKQRKNTILVNGKHMVIPRYNGTALYGTIKGIVDVLSGNFRGEKGIKIFQERTKEAESINPHLRVSQGTIFNISSVTVWSPEYAKLILFAKDSDLEKSNLGQSLTENFLGDSILQANGDSWKAHKTALSPAFTYKHIQSIIPTFVDIAKSLETKLFDETEKEASIPIGEWIKKATLDAIGRGGFGFNFNALDEGAETKEIKQYERLIEDFENPIHFFEKLDRLLGGRARIDKELSEFEVFMQNLITTKREIIRDAGESWKPEDILDFLLSAEQNHSLSDRQIAHDMNTFFIAGHETTAGALTSCLHLLAKNPEAQDKLREEIFAVCGNGDPTQEDIKKIDYLNYCIKETLRLVPPAFAVTRTAAKDQEIGDLHVSKGTMMFINILSIHRAKDIYGEDADDFRPERFGDRDSIPSGAFIPFSIGTRQCIGNNFAMLEMKTFLAILVQRFKFALDPKSKPANLYFGTVLTMTPGSHLLVTPVS